MKYASIKRWRRIVARRHHAAVLRRDDRKNKRALLDTLMREHIELRDVDFTRYDWEIELDRENEQYYWSHLDELFPDIYGGY